MKMKKSYITLVILLVIGGGYFWYKKTHTASTAITYKTTAVQKGTLTSSVSGSGNVVVDQSENIDPTIVGTVANLSVKIGDQVKKGQLLFNIVNDQLGVNAAKSAASSAQAKKAVDDQKYNKKKDQAAYKLNPKKINKDQVALDDHAIDVAEQDLAVSQADYQNQLSDAAKRKVTAPIDGTVNAVNVKNGDDLSKLSSGSSRTVPMIIGDLGTMKAQVQINEVDMPNVQIGQKVMMTFNSVAGLSASGKVEKLDSLGTITQGVVTYNATINFDALDSRIKPGMSVSASIITGVKQDVIVVPNSAVKKQGNNSYVEVLNSGGSSPEQVTIQTGAVNNTDTEIVSGLSVGDQVVTRTINPNATTNNSSQGGARLPGIGGGRLGG